MNGDALPLYDLNGMFVRHVPVPEAEHMVDAGYAEKLIPGGWRDRTDVPWEGIKLVVPRDYVWSRTALNHVDAQMAAGEFGGFDADFAAKMLLWRFVGDTKAPRVI